MHFFVCIEDVSGKTLLDILLPKLIGSDDTFEVKSYKGWGCGHIPSGLKPKSDAQSRILLDRLPRIIHGLGNAWKKQGTSASNILVVVCDLDDWDEKMFLKQLNEILNTCENKDLQAVFCLAIEEGEAWLLGDQTAIKKPIRRQSRLFWIAIKMIRFVVHGRNWRTRSIPKDRKNCVRKVGLNGERKSANGLQKLDHI